MRDAGFSHALKSVVDVLRLLDCELRPPSSLSFVSFRGLKNSACGGDVVPG
jgi:hypothetical protein